MGYFYNDFNGITLIGPCAFKYRDFRIGIAAVGVGFLANAWVLAHLRVGFSYILNVE
jgi:hypothetical protein